MNAAGACCVLPHWHGPDGRRVEVPEATLRHFRAILGEKAANSAVINPASARPVATPCHLPDFLLQRPAFGLSAQLYELRSARNWGIGDFADLADLCRISADAGADFVGLNPLHALFLADPRRCSPFSPSNRHYLNPLYIAVDMINGFSPAMASAAELARLRATEFVDYPAVARLKLAALRRIWQHEQPALTAADLQLQNHALFESLSLHMVREGHPAGWPDWPPAFRNPTSTEVRGFAAAHAEEIGFHIWLQQLARTQLRHAAAIAIRQGMRIGLYLDFAVGDAPDGSASWSDPDHMVRDVHLGAPPDLFSAAGQDWGLAPLAPAAILRDEGRLWRGLLGAAMQNAGALRLDHVMALRQQFWIPAGRPAAEGGYVRYPMHSMLEALGKCSIANETLIVGEDLGNVPEGFRDTMAAARILSYRILYFEQEGGCFRTPAQWPRHALACLSTHDLTPLRGWWAGSDIGIRAAHGLIDPPARMQQETERQGERRALVDAFLAAGLLPGLDAHRLAENPRPGEADLAALTLAAHHFIGRTPSLLAAYRLADAVGEERPTNLPGTSSEYPNWQLKLGVPLEELAAHSLFAAINTALATERPR